MREKGETQRPAKTEAIQQARAKTNHQASEKELPKLPLQPGRYLFQDQHLSGDIDGLKFTLSEVDLRPEILLIHVDVENVGVDRTLENPWGEQRYIRLCLVSSDGTLSQYTAIHVKEGALSEGNGSMTLPPVGKRGAFVMEFPSHQNPTSMFSLTVNDQPRFSTIKLHKARFQLF